MRPSIARDIIYELLHRVELGTYEAGQQVTTVGIRKEFGCGQSTAMIVLAALEARNVLYREPGDKLYKVADRDEKDSESLLCPNCHQRLTITVQAAARTGTENEV